MLSSSPSFGRFSRNHMVFFRGGRGGGSVVTNRVKVRVFKITLHFDTTKILRSHPFRRWIMTRLLLTVMGHTQKRISTYYQNILYLFPPRRMSFLSLQNIFHLFLLNGFHAEFDQDRNQSHRLQRKKGIQKPQNSDNSCVNWKIYESSIFIEMSLTLLGER